MSVARRGNAVVQTSASFWNGSANGSHDLGVQMWLGSLLSGCLVLGRGVAAVTVQQVEMFDLASVPAADRLGYGEELLSRTHADLSLKADPNFGDFGAEVRRIWIDDLALVDATCQPCSGIRTPERVRRSRDDYVVVLINVHGREAVSQGGSSAVLGRGDVVVWDAALPFSFQVLEPLRKRSLMVPKSALREVGAQSVRAAGTALNPLAPETELLTSYLEVLSRTADRLDPAGRASARSATLNLLAAALQPLRAPEEKAPSLQLRSRVMEWIEIMLDSPELGPATIAVTHHISVRSVHRLFEGSGDTAANYIRTRRLARARDDLALTPDPIAAIAARWCFSDASHFTRAFRERYGVSPGAYRAGRGGGRRSVGPVGAAVPDGRAHGDRAS